VSEGKWKEAVRAYLAAISFADTLVGEMLHGLNKSAYAQNTIIVFWSDNGWHLGEKQHWHKSTLWQRSTHIPMILAGPGVQASGTARTQPVSLLDLYPTLIDLCGLSARDGLDGESLAPLLRDPKATRKPTVSTMNQGNHAVISERWRYIRYNDGTEELYDRVADPNEYRNVARLPQHASLKADLAQYLPKTNAAPVLERKDYDFDFATHTWKKK